MRTSDASSISSALAINVYLGVRRRSDPNEWPPVRCPFLRWYDELRDCCPPVAQIITSGAQIRTAGLVLPINQLHRQQNGAAYDLQTVLRHLVHRVGVGVVEFTHGVKTWSHPAVLRVDHIHRRDADFYKRRVVVNDVGVVLEEVLAVPKLIGGLSNEDLQRTAGAGLARHVQISIAYHVEEKQPANAKDASIGRQFLR